MKYASQRWMGAVAVCLGGWAVPAWANPPLFPDETPAFAEQDTEASVSLRPQTQSGISFSDAAGSVRMGGSPSGSVAAEPIRRTQHEVPQLSPMTQAEVLRPAPPVFQEAMIPADSGVGYAQTRDLNQILWRLGRVNIDQFGFNGGYTNFNGFVPLFSGNGESLIFINPRIGVTDYGMAVANVGAGVRTYSPSRDRVFGASFWYDYDDGHSTSFNQLGGSFESIGQYLSFRGNVYIPVGDRRSLAGFTDGAQSFTENYITVQRNYLFDNAYQVYEAEASVPMPILGKYGFDMGAGIYFLNGEDVKDATGVSSRIQAQVTENFWMNGTYTYDDIFRSNFSLNFEFTMPDGAPRRWFRRPSVSSYLTQSVQRRYRVATSRMTISGNVRGEDENGNDITIVYIDPNAPAGGDGTIENPYQSTDEYAADPNSSRYQFIYVRQGTAENMAEFLNSGITLVEYIPQEPGDSGIPAYGQKLIGEIGLAAEDRPFYDVFFDGVYSRFQLPNDLGLTDGSTPILSNYTGGGNPVVTIASGNGHEIYGLTINGATSVDDLTPHASGIVTTGTTDGFLIHRNTFQNVINGIVINSDTSVDTGLTYDDYGRIVNNTFVGSVLGDEMNPIYSSHQAININHTNGDLNLLIADNTIDNFRDGATSGGIFVSATGANSRINGVTFIDPVTNLPVGPELGILRNTIDSSGTGISLSTDNSAEFATDIADNSVLNSTEAAGAGLRISATNDSDVFVNQFVRNTFSMGAGDGANFFANNSRIVFQGIGDERAENANIFNGNADDGMDILVQNGGLFGVINPIVFNQFNANGDDGLVGRAESGGSIIMMLGDLNVAGNTFAGNGTVTGTGSGIDLTADGAGSNLNVPIYNNIISGNSGAGISYTLNNVTVEDYIDIQGNSIFSNGGDGILVSATNSPIQLLRIANNPDIRDNGGHGINLQIVDSDIDLVFIDNNGLGVIAPPSESDFNIVVQFNGGLTPSQQAIFAQAEQIWEQIIIGDLPDVGPIDDVLIVASGVNIDGVNGTLGQAGPTDLRDDGSFLPYAGVMEFDTADLAALEASGQLLDVILHEMAHVLGFGTIWDLKGVLADAGTNDPRYTGAQATAEYNTIFSQNGTSIPVENTGGPGTADAHWRESVFDNELMTGYLDPGVNNPISRVTVAQWADLGYEVNINNADNYTPPNAIIGSNVTAGPVEDLGSINRPEMAVTSQSLLPSLVNLANIRANGLNGINIQTSGSSIEELIISRNVITDHANGTGVHIEVTNVSNISNLTINNNLIDNNQFHGINIVAAGASTLPSVGNGLIANNIITNQVTGDGVRIINPDTGGVAFGMDFVGNEISNNGGMGVNVQINDAGGGITSNFTGNDISGNGLFGINYTGRQSAELVLNIGGPDAEDGNLISGNRDANIAFNLANTATGTILVQNSAILNALNGPDVTFDGEGISLNVTDNASLTSAEIRDNLISGNAGDGIELLANAFSTVHAAGDPTSTGLLVVGNQISDNGLNGIDITRQGNAVVKAIIGDPGTFDPLNPSDDSNMIVNNGGNGISINASGSTVTPDAVNVIAGQNLIAGNAANGVTIVTAGTANARVDLLNNDILGTFGTGGSTQQNGISVTTNDASYFGTVNGPNSQFDGNVIGGHSANGIDLTRANTGSAISEMHIDIFGTDRMTEIFDNGASGIRIRDFSNQQVLDPSSVAAVMEVNIGNPASYTANNPQEGRTGSAGSDVFPDRPDVAIYHNTRDAVEIIQQGSEVLVVDINNTLALGGQDNGTTSRHGLSFNADQQVVSGADTFILVNGSTFTGFGEDGMNFFFDTNAGFSYQGPVGNVAVRGTLNVLVENSIIGQNEFSFNEGDGVDIEVRDTGSNFVFDNNVIQNNGGDGFRMSLHAENLTSGINNSANRPRVLPDRDDNNDGNADTVTPNNPELNNLANYNYLGGNGAPYADMAFIDVYAGLTLTNNLIRYNGDDGVDLVLGAATSLGVDFVFDMPFYNGPALGVPPAGLNIDARLLSFEHARVINNDMSGNATNGFYTRTQDALPNAVVGTSGPRTTANAQPPGNRQFIQLDPLAHMWLDFENNIGSVLNPTVLGGVYNDDPTKTATTNRPIQTNFNVFFNGTNNIFTVAGGGPDALTALQRFQLQWNTPSTFLTDSGAGSPSYGYFINGTAIFNDPVNNGINP